MTSWDPGHSMMDGGLPSPAPSDSPSPLRPAATPSGLALEPQMAPAPTTGPSPTPAPTPSPTLARRTILLFGYWPPTDIGIDTRHGMLWDWRALQSDYNGSGYDVLAISPTFEDQIGSDSWGPAWGMGTGQLPVDFRATSKDFWAIVAQHRPIAIMSFSRGEPGNEWKYERSPRNLPKLWSPYNGWATFLTYNGTDNVPRMMSHCPPFAGGSDDDYSPYKGTGTENQDPPDPSTPYETGPGREANLPWDEITTALQAEFDPSELEVTFNDGNAGAYVSEYMAYHVAWYRYYTMNVAFQNDPSKQCKRAGHTHVGINVSVADAARAVEIQLGELIDVLP